MPSRPMLTTPARSDHSPPRPARAIGHRQGERGADGAAGGEVVGAGDHAHDGEQDDQRRAPSSTNQAPDVGMRAGFAVPASPGSCADEAHARHPRRSRPVCRPAELATDPALLRDDAVAADQLVGDDDGEHDRRPA